MYGTVRVTATGQSIEFISSVFGAAAAKSVAPNRVSQTSKDLKSLTCKDMLHYNLGSS